MDKPTQPASFVILVAAGKGGVGKSTISLNLAHALLKYGPTGLLDADVYGPDLPRMLNLKREESATHWDLWRREGMQIEPVERFGLKVLSTGFVLGEATPLIWHADMVNRLLWQFLYDADWGSLEFLVVDLPPGTMDLHQGLANSVDVGGAIVVVTPNDVSHLDARRTIEMLRRARIPIIGGVENMSGLTCPHCRNMIATTPPVSNARSIWAAGVTQLGSIPLDPVVAQAADVGCPVSYLARESSVAEAFQRLADGMAAYAREPGSAESARG